MNFQKKYFFVFLLILFSGSASAASITWVKGYADLSIETKGKIYHVTQVIVIDSDNATFESMDDFGNTLFRFTQKNNQIILEAGSKTYHLKQNKFKKLAKLPMPMNELIEYLKGTNLLSLIKEKNGKLVYKVEYQNWKKTKNGSFPLSTKISSPKTTLTFTWQKVDFGS